MHTGARWAVLLIVAAGCREHHEPVAPKPRDVELIAPGAEPRRVLRYAAPKGSRSTFELAIDVDVAADALHQKLPTIEVGVEQAVDDVLPDGRMQLRSTIVEANARERDGSAPAVTIAGPVAQLIGVVLTATLAPDGAITDVAVAPGNKPLGDAAAQQLNAVSAGYGQLATRLPDVAVGAGASWRSTRKITQAGLLLTSTTTVTLAAAAGDQITLDDAAELTGADQTATLQNVAIDVKDLHGASSGHAEIELGKLTTKRSYEGTLTTKMTSSGETSAITLTSKLTQTPK